MTMARQSFFADDLVSPHPRGGLEKISPALIEVQNGKIRSVEKASRLSAAKHSKRLKRLKTVIPGLVDCHTHLVFAGQRASEWNLKLQGMTYQEIAKRGGGIASTVRATRNASLQELQLIAKQRLKRFLDYGVTTIEIKSGYGLSLDSEFKILQVIQALKNSSPQKILTTFMAAHALPKEFETHSQYVDWIIETLLPQIRGLADFQDVFCEKGYFNTRDSIRLLNAGRKLGLIPKVHAHEFGRSGGVEAAVKTKAVSADHLMHLSSGDIGALKRAKVIPVLLPGTTFFLKEKSYAPARKLLDSGLQVALGSDFNPGTCPTMNFPLIGTLAAIQLGMTLDEVLCAQTYHSALALNLKDRGMLKPRMCADFVELDSAGFEELYYSFGVPPISRVFIGGSEV